MKIRTSFRWLPNNSKNPSGQGYLQMLFNYGYKELDVLKQKTKYKPLVYSCEISLEYKDWDKNQQTIVRSHPMAKKLNAELGNLEEGILSVYKHLTYNGKTPTPIELRQELDIKLKRVNKVLSIIDQPISEFIKTQLEVGLESKTKKQTLKNYQTLIEKIESFEAHMQLKQKNFRLHFSYLNKTIYNAFFAYINDRGYVKTSRVYDERLKRVVKVTSKEYYTQNTMSKTQRNLNHFMTVAEEKGLKFDFNYKHKDITYKEESVDNVHLDFDELELIYKFDLAKAGREGLQTTRDLFILSSFTALRYSDNSRMNSMKIETSIQNGKKIRYISLKTQKTGENVILPCFKPVEELYKKYAGIFPKSASNQKFNLSIKELGKLVGLDKEVSLSRTRNGKVITRTYKKHETLSTHTGRRNAATNFYRLGVPALTLMKLTGHKKIESFIKYVKCSDIEHLSLMYEIVRNKKPELITA